jgi:hypothetical protein
VRHNLAPTPRRERRQRESTQAAAPGSGEKGEVYLAHRDLRDQIVRALAGLWSETLGEGTGGIVRRVNRALDADADLTDPPALRFCTAPAGGEDEGQAMTLDEAVACALEDAPDAGTGAHPPDPAPGEPQ